MHEYDHQSDSHESAELESTTPPPSPLPPGGLETDASSADRPDPATESPASGTGTPGHHPFRASAVFGLPETPYREVTLSAVLFALIIGVVLNASITYAGLKIGFTIGGSAIAAVVGFGILRGLLRPFIDNAGSVVEVNIAQTIASAVNTPNSGVIFTVPVLFLVGVTLDWSQLDFWLIVLACVAGGVLGTAFIIPLRKQMIEIDRLRFPSAVGVATILKSPGGGVKKTLVLVAGILLAAAIYAPTAMHTLPVRVVDAATLNASSEQRPLATLIKLQKHTKTSSNAADTDSTNDANDAQHDTQEPLDTLDKLVLRERLTVEQAQLTRTINQWIKNKKAPDELAKRGELLEELREAQTRLAQAKKDLNKKVMPAGTRETIASIKNDIASIQTRLDSKDLQPFAKYPDELAIAIFHIKQGFVTGSDGAESRSWEDLRQTRYGWAANPLWGYQDLQLRLFPYGDPDRPGKLHERVDRNGDGQPDLVVTDETVDLGRVLGLPDHMQLIFAIAPFALGAGFITGRAGLLVLAGGILAFFVITPMAYSFGWLGQTVGAADAPGVAFGAFNRPLGIGLLLGGALMGVLASMPAIAAALKSLAMAGRTAGKGGRDEMGLGPLILAIVFAGGLLFLAADYVGTKPINEGGLCPVTGLEVTRSVEPVVYKGYSIAFATDQARRIWETGGSLDTADDLDTTPHQTSTDHDSTQADDTPLDGAQQNNTQTTRTIIWDEKAKDAYLASLHAKPGWLAGVDPHLRSAIIAIVGVLWIWFAGIIIAQCTGMTDWSPISGMALLTVVLVLLMAGTGAIVGAVLIGAALCVAITLAADMMGDLKTGHLVGAKPIRQQRVELAMVWIGPVVSMLVILLIVQVNLKTTGIAIGPGTPTSAPQAQALQAVIQGVQGGDMPYVLYGLGSLLGVLLGLGSFSGLGVLVGLSMYLPFMYIATYGIGCVVNILLRAFKGPRWTEEWGVPFAAGLIVGESILSLLFNMYVLAAG